MTKNPLAANIWKYFWFCVTQRRHFITILSIYFLTLNNTTAQQIGIYTAAGGIASFLLEIPSGYLADRWGHKNTLVLSKVLCLLSTTFFLLAKNVVVFSLGSICLALGFAFASGTNAAFMHNTLFALKREKEYTKIMSKNGANVSIISAALIVTLPLLTTIAIQLPIIVNGVFDIIGLFIALSFSNPPQKFKEHDTKASLLSVLKYGTQKGFYPLILFLGAIGGFMIAENGYRYAYLASLGYPIAFLGLVMGLSRVIWFLIGNHIHKIEHKLNLKILTRWELIIFPAGYLIVAWLDNPYLVGLFFSVIIGYYWGRKSMIQNWLLGYVRNPNFKATTLSITSQVSTLFQAIIGFGIGYIMNVSFAIGYSVFAALLFIILFSSRIWWRIKEKNIQKV